MTTISRRPVLSRYPIEAREQGASARALPAPDVPFAALRREEVRPRVVRLPAGRSAGPEDPSLPFPGAAVSTAQVERLIRAADAGPDDAFARVELTRIFLRGAFDREARDLFRRYFARASPPTEAELASARSVLSDRTGAIGPEAIERLLLWMTADGAFSEAEQRFLDRLRRGGLTDDGATALEAFDRQERVRARARRPDELSAALSRWLPAEAVRELMTTLLETRSSDTKEAILALPEALRRAMALASRDAPLSPADAARVAEAVERLAGHIPRGTDVEAGLAFEIDHALAGAGTRLETAAGLMARGVFTYRTELHPSAGERVALFDGRPVVHQPVPFAIAIPGELERFVPEVEVDGVRRKISVASEVIGASGRIFIVGHLENSGLGVGEQLFVLDPATRETTAVPLVPDRFAVPFGSGPFERAHRQPKYRIAQDGEVFVEARDVERDEPALLRLGEDGWAPLAHRPPRAIQLALSGDQLLLGEPPALWCATTGVETAIPLPEGEASLPEMFASGGKLHGTSASGRLFAFDLARRAWSVLATTDVSRERPLSVGGDSVGTPRFRGAAWGMGVAALSKDELRARLLAALARAEASDLIGLPELADCLRLLWQAERAELPGDFIARFEVMIFNKPVSPEAAGQLGRDWFVRRPRGFFEEALGRALEEPPLTRAGLELLGAAAWSGAPDRAALFSSLPAEAIPPELAPAADAIASQLLAADLASLARAGGPISSELDACLVRAVRLRERRSARGEGVEDLDRAVRELLLSDAIGSGDARHFWSYLGAAGSPSRFALEMALEALLGSTGELDLAGLQTIAAMIDSDGHREPHEVALVERLARLPLSPAARARLGALERGVTSPDDLAGREDVDPARAERPGGVVVWSRENRLSSGGETVQTAFPEPVTVSPEGIRTRRVHVSGATVLSSVEGHRPTPDGGGVTSDAFDQVNALWVADHLLRKLERLGVDLDSLQARGSNDGVLRIKVNSDDSLNAEYNPEANEITTGTSSGEFHLASDGDMIAHEVGHYVLDSIHPGDFQQLHEAFADMIASLDGDDPEISEDWIPDPAAEVRPPKPPFLRTVAEATDLSSTSSEAHERSAVYGGLVWSIKRALTRLLGDGDRAAERMLAVVVRHAFYYTGVELRPDELVDNLERALAAELSGVLDAASLRALLDFARREAVRLEMVSPGERYRAEHGEVVDRLNQHEGAPLLSTAPAAELAELLRAAGVAGGGAAVAFAAAGDVRMSGVRKLRFQLESIDPATGERTPVAGRFVTLVIEGDRVAKIGGV